MSKFNSFFFSLITGSAVCFIGMGEPILFVMQLNTHGSKECALLNGPAESMVHSRWSLSSTEKPL